MLEKKIKILFQLNSLGYGGTEKAIFTFLENIDLDKFTPYVYFNTDKGSLNYFRIIVFSIIWKKYKKKYDEKYVISFARLSDFSRLLGDNLFVGNGFDDFIEVIHKIKPDIVHFNRGTYDDFYTVNIKQIPENVKIVETNIFGEPSNENYLKRLSRIFYVSCWLQCKATWGIGYPSEVLYNPIKKVLTHETLREELGIPRNAIVLGRISRPNLDDGQFVYDVLQQVLTKNIWFVSIGSSEQFKENTKNMPNVICLQPTTDAILIDKFYNTLDILLHYRIEGETFGMNIAEAMMHSVPVVSHNSVIDNAQVELIQPLNDLCGGFVVNLQLNEYIEKVRNLINDTSLRKSMALNAKNIADKSFVESTVMRQLEAHYYQILEE
ncbi:MAG: glycosyltransferase [Arcobacteraceae bacterium]